MTTVTYDGATAHFVRLEEARHIIATSRAPLVLNASMTTRKLGLSTQGTPRKCRDLLELFFFLYPTRSVAPTVQGVCEALDLSIPERPDAKLLVVIYKKLEQHLETLLTGRRHKQIYGLLDVLVQQEWPWRTDMRALITAPPVSAPDRLDAIKIWRRLPKWEDTAPPTPPASRPVKREAALAKLDQLIGPEAESRPAQRDFTSVACAAFAPREAVGVPELVLAEAGTGTGKTAGYLAPATLWAEDNGGTVWVSTYTRHLQKQIERELHHLFPNRAIRREKVVIRKGRENYLCLLNFEDAVNLYASRPSGETQSSLGTLLTLVARWAEETEDGDLIGGDLPGWFADLYDKAALVSLADRRGECIYSACPHYQSCFVEHSIRRAMTAEIVVANHALVMAQSAWALQEEVRDLDEDMPPTHYIFDEGHHLPDAADSAFSVAFSGLEATELRRWLLGAEGGRSRARGLRRRLDDLVVEETALERALLEVISAAQALPPGGWLERLQSRPDVAPSAIPVDTLALEENPSEAFLQILYRQLLARAHQSRQKDQTECDLFPAEPALITQAKRLQDALYKLKKPLEQTVAILTARLADAEVLEESNQRIRLQATARTLRRRAIQRLDAWIALLATVISASEKTQEADRQFIDIIRSEAITNRRFNGTRYDVGIHRHWRDPTIPFATVMQGVAHGLLVTSATLRDQPAQLKQTPLRPVIEATLRSEDDTSPDVGKRRLDTVETSWRAAEQMIGASHFIKPALRAAMMSPFDYGNQTRAYVVTDVSHRDIRELAMAFQALFEASGGGALGLFTAISRLRQTYRLLAPALESAKISFYAQHVDQMDNATLVDIFRTEIGSCLLGTDAMRDGIDVKGEALRLVVYEKTPWPRPDILHRERRRHAQASGLTDYDDRIARMRIRQGFGRLIRSSSDRGIFVILDKQFPSRLLSAFPEGVVVERLGLKEVSAKVRDFFAGSDSADASDETS